MDGKGRCWNTIRRPASSSIKNTQILFIHGRTGKYLEPVAGETNTNLVRMAREGLKTELATAIHAAMAHKETVRREGIQVKTNGDYQAINLTVRLVAGRPIWRPDPGGI